MLFNTFEYFFFFIAVLVVAWCTAGHSRFRTLFLLASSIYFYASNNSWQTLLLLFTTTVDYWICLKLACTEDQKKRKYLLSISIISNIGLLAWFKYVNFFGHSIAGLAAAFGVHLSWITLNVALPVGISFYTFEALSYTIDVYRRRIPAEKDWSRLAFLVTFFPHLIAGPIIRAADFFPQIGRRSSLSNTEFEQAILLIVIGLLKKIVIADQLAPYADAAFNDPFSIGTTRAWLGVYAFAFQIFFDFSGYSDIAIGCAKLLGFSLPENFRRPYVAQNITDFWRRWHISLSTWLRDYLYISLGGNRMPTKFGVYRNLMLVMLLGGLWHGAAWTFVCWGALHGFYLSIERALGIGRKTEQRNGLFMQLISILITFNFVVFTWIPFRAETLDKLKQLLAVMLSPTPGPALSYGAIVISCVMLLAWLWQLAGERWEFGHYWCNKTPLLIKAFSYASIGTFVLVLGSDVPKSFIYFRF